MPATGIYRVLVNEKVLKADLKLQYMKNEKGQVKGLGKRKALEFWNSLFTHNEFGIQGSETSKSWMINASHVQVWWVNWAFLVTDLIDKCQKRQLCTSRLPCTAQSKDFYKGWNNIIL